MRRRAQDASVAGPLNIEPDVSKRPPIEKLRQAIHAYPFNYAPVEADKFLDYEPAALYIHVPFCRQKCHFCDFTVYLNKGEDIRDAYVDNLCEEIRLFADSRVFAAYRIEAIYIGGGTPGLLSNEQLSRVLMACRRAYPIADGCEISVEFDPLAVSEQRIVDLKNVGVTRVSVGVQSFHDQLLRESNRPHNSADAERAFAALGRAGMTNTNIDLIYPLPGLTMEIWLDTVAKAIALEPASVTTYGLEVWPGTVFHTRLRSDQLAWPSSETEVAMYRAAADALAAAGFIPRSVNGYSHPGRTANYSRYLDFYWTGLPTIGFGVSARSAVGERVWTNVTGLRQYGERIGRGELPLQFGRRLSKREEMRRSVIRGLKAGQISTAAFATRYGVDIDEVFSTTLAALLDDELIVHDTDAVRLTPLGRALVNNVLARFVDPDQVVNDGEVSIGRSLLVEHAAS